MQTANNVSSVNKRPYMVNGKQIWATSQADAEWQYQQMEKQLRGGGRR